MHHTEHMHVKAHARKRNNWLLYLGKTFQVNVHLIINLNQYLFHSNQSQLNEAICARFVRAFREPNQVQHFKINLKQLSHSIYPISNPSLNNFKNLFLKNYKKKPRNVQPI